jgi:DNA topoisomerase IA
MPNLLLIESPGKLKKLSQILGSNWLIKASMGHIRQLAEDGEDALGFSFANGAIDCHYQPKDARSKKVLTELRQAVGISSKNSASKILSASSTAKSHPKPSAKRSPIPVPWINP